jgi:flagellar protein FlgJ
MNINGIGFSLPVTKAMATKEDKALKDAAKQFEALLIYQMLEQMRQTVTSGGLFEESMGEKIFKGMLDQEISLKVADNGNLGLAQIIFEQLKTKK